MKKFQIDELTQEPHCMACGRHVAAEDQSNHECGYKDLMQHQHGQLITRLEQKIFSSLRSENVSGSYVAGFLDAQRLDGILTEDQPIWKVRAALVVWERGAPKAMLDGLKSHPSTHNGDH